MMGRVHWTLQLQALLLVVCALARNGSGTPTPEAIGTITSFETFSDTDTTVPTTGLVANASLDKQTTISALVAKTTAEDRTIIANSSLQGNDTPASDQPPTTSVIQTSHASKGTSTQQSTTASFEPSTHTTHLLTTHSMSSSATQSTTQSTAQSTTQSTAQSTTQSTAQSTTQSTAQSTTQSTAQSTTQSTAQSTTQSTIQSTSASHRVTSPTPKSSMKHTTQAVPSNNHSDGDWNIIGIRNNSFTGKILLPIAIGILFSVIIIAVAYIYCSRKRPRRVSKQNGNGAHGMTSLDRVMLLADSSEDEF